MKLHLSHQLVLLYANASFDFVDSVEYVNLVVRHVDLHKHRCRILCSDHAVRIDGCFTNDLEIACRVLLICSVTKRVEKNVKRSLVKFLGIHLQSIVESLGLRLGQDIFDLCNVRILHRKWLVGLPIAQDVVFTSAFILQDDLEQQCLLAINWFLHILIKLIQLLRQFADWDNFGVQGLQRGDHVAFAGLHKNVYEFFLIYHSISVNIKGHHEHFEFCRVNFLSRYEHLNGLFELWHQNIAVTVYISFLKRSQVADSLFQECAVQFFNQQRGLLALQRHYSLGCRGLLHS